MKKNDVSRIDKWIDSRLENIKEQNKQIDTQKILVELIHFFNIQITKKNERAMKAKVAKIRNRVNKRHERKLTFYKNLAKDLVVPISLIDRWTRKGWIVPNSKNRNESLVKLIREIEYYHSFKPDIPENIETPIWHD